MIDTAFDLQIQADVHAALSGNPEVNLADIGILVRNGVVTLRGTVEQSTQKWAAECSALQITGVRMLMNDLDLIIHARPQQIAPERWRHQGACQHQTKQEAS
jgi:osmotically-inducible protein OsmY